MPLVIVPARDGSKGVPGKNIADVLGHPLMRYTFETLLQVLPASSIYFSTNSPEFMDLAESWGVPRRPLRPASLASDDATMHEVLYHVLHETEVAAHSGPVLLCQPTAPFRSPNDIRGMLTRMAEVAPHSVVSVTTSEVLPTQIYALSHESHLLVPVDSRAHSGANRQTVGRYVRRNGSMYGFDADYLRTHRTVYTNPTFAFVMPRRRSVDINSSDDLDGLRLDLAARGVDASRREAYLHEIWSDEVD